MGNEFVNVIISFLKMKLAGSDFVDYGIQEEDRSFLEHRARMLFESADKDGNGLLTDPEIGRLILRLPILYVFAEPENLDDMDSFFTDMIQMNDADGDGLDINEFFNFMVKTYAILTRTLDAAVANDRSLSSLWVGLGFGIFPDSFLDQFSDYYYSD